MKQYQGKIYTIAKCKELLNGFDLGQELLQTGSFNTYWTDLVLKSVQNGSKNYKNELEQFFFEKSYFIRAWKWCETCFSEILNQTIQNDQTIASIPAGSMQEVLSLDLHRFKNITLYAIDIDNESLKLASKNFDEKGQPCRLILENANAFSLPFHHCFDLISSCGLNIYLSDSHQIKCLLENFHHCLKDNGRLIISYLTHPPGLSKNSPWNLKEMSRETWEFELFLFNDVLSAKWLNFSAKENLETMLSDIGFSKLKTHFDPWNIFPVIEAVKI